MCLPVINHSHSHSTNSDKYTPRQVRHLDYISQFTDNIRHVKGEFNPVADALSRTSVNQFRAAQPPVLNMECIARAQAEDTELRTLQSSGSSYLQFITVPQTNSTTSLVCDNSMGTPRPFEPIAFRRVVFDSLHSLAHPGVRTTQRLITERFVWPGMNTDVRKWTKACLHCQRLKIRTTR